MTTAAAPATLPPLFAEWFAGRGWSPRRHQLEMIAAGQDGFHALLVAPTGGGKTLAGFLPSLIDLAERGPKPETGPGSGVHTLYLSPLKALTTDVERNLMTPIREIGLNIHVETRTGDTKQSKRQRQRDFPPDILLTTPEQLALFCAWEGARAYFADLKCVVLDEVHAIWSGKRGDLLSLGLGRLQSFSPGMRRVGLSATIEDPDLIREWLAPRSGSLPGGEDPVRLVKGDPGAPALIDVLISEGKVPWAGHTGQHAIPEVYAAIQQARLALIFVNTRWQSEFVFQQLWAVNDDNLPIGLHHGSLAAEQRRKVEAAMARGDLRAVVCTSTLDLGIDWGDVDLVIQMAAPKGSSRLVQRIGRANHRLDEASRAVLVPANRFEVLECRAAVQSIATYTLDGDPPRPGGLDVLAQHVLGMGCAAPFDADELYAEVTSAAPYSALTRADFDDVLNFVATGGYALGSYDRFKRLVRDEEDGLYRVAGPVEDVQQHGVRDPHAGDQRLRLGGDEALERRRPPRDEAGRRGLALAGLHGLLHALGPLGLVLDVRELRRGLALGRLVLDHVLGGLDHHGAGGVEAGPARPAGDLVELAGLEQAGLLAVELGQRGEQHGADRHVDPDAERVRAADDLEQPVLGQLLHEAAVLGQHARVVDTDAAADELGECLAKRRGEAEVSDFLSDALLFFSRNDVQTR